MGEIKPVEVSMKIKAKEVHRRKVTPLGTGGAHIVFLKDYIGREVVIIPIENGKRKD